MDIKKIIKNIWKFIWEDDSIISWIVNVILAFLIVKFIFYPIIGLLFCTTHPLVAVVSGSMGHQQNFDDWWESNHDWYESYNINEENFRNFIFKNGFNKGDVMVVIGSKPKNIKVGDVLVFRSSFAKDPLIHRIVKKWQKEEKFYFQTKGDNNADSSGGLKELEISEDRIVGKAIIRAPFLGYVKLAFVEITKIGK